MTLKTSSNKINPFLNIFTFTLKKNLGFSLLGTILALLLSPLYLYSVISNYLENYETLIYKYENLFNSFAVAIALAATCFMLVILYINFAFLYNKSASDAFHSMPLSRTELLFARFGGSYISSLIPITVAYIGAFAISFMPEVEANRSVIIESYFFTILMMLMIGVFSLIFIISAGSVFDSIIALLGVNIGLPAIGYFLILLCSTHLYGFSETGETIINIVSFTTPFGYAGVRLAMFLFEPGSVELFSIWRIIGAAAALIVFAAAAILLYNRRKSEKAGMAYAFRFLPEAIGFIISVIGFFMLGYIFASDSDNAIFWIIGAIGALIAGVIYSLITNRGFKKLKRAMAVSLLAIAMVVVIALGIIFDIFGREAYVPQNSDIASVSVSYNGTEIEVRDFSIATNLQKAIIETHKNADDEGDYPSRSFNFEYILKDGSTLNRYYSVQENWAVPEKVRLINEAYSEQLINDFNKIKQLNCNEFFLSGSIYDAEGNFAGDYNQSIDLQTAEKLVLSYAEDMKTVGGEYFDYDLDVKRVNLYGRVETNKIKEELADGDYNLYSTYQTFDVSFKLLENNKNFKKVFETIKLDINADIKK